MRFKPPVPRKRWALAVLASGISLTAFAGLTFSQVSPAMADPTVKLVAVGSDTIQDVYDQFAFDLKGNLLGSYDATNPVDTATGEQITPNEGSATTLASTVKCSFTRPNGSGGGILALRDSMTPAASVNTITGTPVSVAPGTDKRAQTGCVDIARSSGAVDHQSNTGGLIWIPFAEDAVTGASGDTAADLTANPPTPYTYTYTEFSTLGTTNVQNTVTGVTPVATNITTADQFTIADLQTMYDTCGTVQEGGITYWPFTTTGSQPPGTQRIDLYVPQSGSGTAKFWASTLNFTLPGASGGTPPPCVFQEIVNGALASAPGGVTVEEHNGTPMATDPDGFGPFSIAQWISQRKGHNDRRHTAQLHSIVVSGTAVSPFSNGSPTTGNLNGAFPITRAVYSVVSDARVTTSTDPLFSLLNGSGSSVCQNAADILNYGFALLSAGSPGATLFGTCGSLADANRGLVGFPAGS